MKNIYDEQVKTFYYSTCMFIASLQSKPVDIKISQMDHMQEISRNSSLFRADGSKDYHAYFAFLEAYHAIVHYYEYYAKYKKKDENLDMALKDWYKAINQNPKKLSFVIESMKTQVK